MLRIEFVNDGSGTDDSANYKVTVSVNGRVIDRCTISGHRRADHWRKLVARLAQDKPPELVAPAAGGWTLQEIQRRYNVGITAAMRIQKGESEPLSPPEEQFECPYCHQLVVGGEVHHCPARHGRKPLVW